MVNGRATLSHFGARKDKMDAARNVPDGFPSWKVSMRGYNVMSI